MKRAVSFFFLLFLPGCSEEPPTPPPLAPPTLEPIPDITRPDAATENVIDLDTPDPSPEFAWKLPAGTRHSYTLRNTTHSRDLNQGSEQQKLEHEGNLIIEAREDGKADVRILVYPKGGNPLDQETTLRLDYALKENGEIYPVTDMTAQQSGFQLDQLLRLPDRALAVGESTTRTIRTRGGGTTPGQNGTLKITNAGFVKLRRHECVKFEMDLDVELESPKDGALRGGGRLRGRLISYFDWREGVLIQSDASARMALRAYAEVEQQGERQYILMNTDLDTVIRIRKK
jgi:hypothetical protein